jgi:hypothetical protein
MVASTGDPDTLQETIVSDGVGEGTRVAVFVGSGTRVAVLVEVEVGDEGTGRRAVCVAVGGS